MKMNNLFPVIVGGFLLTGCNPDMQPQAQDVSIERTEVSQQVYNALSLCKGETIYDCLELYPHEGGILIDALGIKNTHDWQAMNVIRLYPITEEIYRHYEQDNRLNDLRNVIQLFIDDTLLLDELIKISHSDSYCPEKYCFQNNGKYPIIKKPYGDAFNVINRLENAKIPSRLGTRVSIKSWAMTLGMDSSL